ncbi:hypothetical protein BpHYR1_048951 [Brachionus plicatilis]|uniref:Retrotransposon gag domain-containing protein n=1 Tax=Brachionus plicatilis TaxID=10195 RepID=A0A3M7T6N6_BRAPC|nr:hypothetical protein BpHYR1_048951 [Brachionus plicatilis]
MMFSHFVVVSILTVANLPNVQMVCMYNCQPSLVDLIKSFTANIFESVIGTMNWIIMNNQKEFIIALLVIIVLYLVSKGRHSKKEKTVSNSNAANSSSTNVNLVNTVHCNKKLPNKPSNDRLCDKNLAGIKIPLLTEGYSLQNWMSILRKDKQEWLEVALSNIDENVIKTFQCSINQTNEPENAKNFKNFFERNQRPNETIVAFASSLKAFVRENFPKTDLETFEGIMKERFVEGLNNSRLREKCREKVKKSNRLQLEMSFDDLLTYAID